MAIPTCLLSGTLYDPTGSPLSFASIEIYPDAVPGMGGIRDMGANGFYTGHVIQVCTNRAGEFSVRLLQGIRVRASVPGVIEHVKFCVPSTGTANFFDYAMPCPQSLEWVRVEDGLMYALDLSGGRSVETEVEELLELALAVVWSDGVFTAIDPDDYAVSTDPDDDAAFLGESEENGTIQFNAPDVRTLTLSLVDPPNVDIEHLLEVRLFAFGPSTSYVLSPPEDLELDFV